MINHHRGGNHCAQSADVETVIPRRVAEAVEFLVGSDDDLVAAAGRCLGEIVYDLLGAAAILSGAVQRSQGAPTRS